MSADPSAGGIAEIVTLLGAAVVFVPLFRRLGMGSVLGYLAGGLAIGPFGIGLIRDDGTLLHVAELGVVLFLFVIGLEMRPSHLWRMRRQLFGLGSLQITACALALTLVGIHGFDVPPVVSFVSGMGFVLTSTAIVMQALGERGDLGSPAGQKMVAVLLFEDLMIVPLLAIVAFLSPEGAAPSSAASVLKAIGIAVGSVAALVAAGLWLLNPLFSLLARVKAREVFTAAALLVVLGAAMLMQAGGLSMAMGAFLAGVLLSESSFRHQLEADIEPFRGLLLGLFFLAVGMSLDLKVVYDNLGLIASGVVAAMLAKGACIYLVARLTRSNHDEALDRALMMAQGGEFAFVLYQAASSQKLISATTNANMTAIVVLSMILTPLIVQIHSRIRQRATASTEGIEKLDGQHPAPHGDALLIGFGRVGQIATQTVLSMGASISIIDNDPDVIRAAQRYGRFKVHFGDGSRLDVLRAAGAGEARVILVCIDDRAAATRIAETAKREFPRVQLLVRAFDREHALELVKTDSDYVVRETFESALLLGRRAAVAMGADDEAADELIRTVRARDAERFALEVSGGRFAGRALVLGNVEHIEPPPRKTPQVSDEELSRVRHG